MSQSNVDMESHMSAVITSDSEDRLLRTVSSGEIKVIIQKSSTPNTRDNSPSVSKRDEAEKEKDISEVCWKHY